MQIQLITALLVGAALTAMSGQIARRFKVPDAVGAGFALSAIGVGLWLTPGSWRSALPPGDVADRILVLLRDIGITGLLFIAGSRFDLDRVLKARSIFLRVVSGALLLFAISVVGLTALVKLDLSVAIVVTAAIVATSIWLPANLSHKPAEKQNEVSTTAMGAAVTLAGICILAVHLLAAFRGVSGRGSAAYVTIALYELVKLFVFFSLAYLVVSRFVARAEGRVSKTRITIGYLLIAALLFVLARLVVGELAALCWPFAAGALFARIDVGKRFGETYKPAASGVFLSLAFLPLFFQPHGRIVPNIPLLIVAIAGALIIKFAIAWIAAKTAGIAREGATLIAGASLGSGEIAVALLGFGLTQWVIEGPEYFAVLSFALLSMIIGPFLCRPVIQDKSAAQFAPGGQIAELDKERQRTNKRRRNKRATFAVSLLALVLTAAGQSTRAQSAAPVSQDDPVSRAMKAIEASVDHRAEAANRVIAASKLVNESAAAKRQGQRNRAIEALKEAQGIASTGDPTQRSALIEEMNAVIASELQALSPMASRKPVFSSGEHISKAIPQSARARLNAYRPALTLILEEEKVPAELLAVALVESGFNPQALSPKGARGIWQFMPATARRYGLLVGPGEDHRTHPEHSTRAAARYLRKLYNQFGDWKLALAAYNTGEARVQRIIDRTGIRDFDEMARRGLLPAETRNYVPAVLAVWARLSGTNPLKTADARKGVIRAAGSSMRP